MDGLRRMVARHPLAAFVVLAYALSWWPAPLVGGVVLPHGPFVAAVIVLALTEGRSGLARLFGRMGRWRVGWRWYLLAPGLVIAYLLVALVLNLLLGATIAGTEHLRLASIAGTVVELLLLGGLWEEPGWSGYSLPLLQARFDGRPYGMLRASLIMGAVRAGWHLPLLAYGHIPWYDVVFFALALQFLISWVFNRTRGSVLMTMLLHLTSNVVGGGILVPLFVGADYTRFYVLFIAAAWALALLLVHGSGWAMGRRGDAAEAEMTRQPAAVGAEGRRE